MFKLKLADTDLLRNSMPIIAEIIDEGTFKIDKNGMSLLSPDRTMVSVVDFKILSSAFEDFKIDGEESIGLNMSSFVSVLKRLKTGDKLTLESSENKLRMIIEGSGMRTFTLPIIDVQSEKPPLDQLDFGGKVELDSSIVEEGIADADIIGDSVIFEAGPNMFKMHSKGDVSSTELSMGKDNQGITGITAENNIKAQYPLEYLKKMIKATKLSKQTTIEFGNDYPMRLTFKAIDKMSLNFILAPRVIED
ncbi:MAG: proliferating cell nuclear antigen (pcna) [Candidatus Aenigmatarchaeota archaeon]